MKRKYVKRYQRYFFVVSVSLILLLLFIGGRGQREFSAPATRHAIHIHADFKVFIDDKEINFSLQQYNVRDRRIHLHTGNDFGGDVIHIEDKNVGLIEFFSSLSMSLTDNCFSTTNETFCSNENKKLIFYVNGKKTSVADYSISDLNRILISYGNETEEMIEKQLGSVTSLACVFSAKCAIPEGLDIVTL